MVTFLNERNICTTLRRAPYFDRNIGMHFTLKLVILIFKHKINLTEVVIESWGRTWLQLCVRR
jgi:hypothetical protein